MSPPRLPADSPSGLLASTLQDFAAFAEGMLPAWPDQRDSTQGLQMKLEFSSSSKIFQLLPRAAQASALSAALFLGGCGDDEAEPDVAAAELDGKSFVLVHGAWNGAWVWEEVETRLKAKGASVRSVTLPAHADDETLPTQVSLAAYVDRVLSVMDAGTPVTLLGHSFGGVVISLTAERRPEAVERLIYVGAFLPADGETALELAMSDTESDLGAALEFDMERGVVGIQREAFPPLFCADCSEAHLSVLGEKYSDEPLAPLVEPIELSETAFGATPKYYLFTAEDRVLSPSFQQRVAGRVDLAGSATLNTSHSPFFSAPDRLVASVSELARAR
jgi:pimeloyl-ACP methyl ester carboxylesterase